MKVKLTSTIKKPRLPRILAMISIGYLSGFNACLFSEKEGTAANENMGKSGVRLVLSAAALMKGDSKTTVPNVSQVPQLDSILIRITADDIQPIRIMLPGDSMAISLEDLPAGSNRVVVAELYRKNQMMYSGKGTFTFEKEKHAELSLSCLPQFSRVVTRFHIPMGQSVPITDGALKILNKTHVYSAKLYKQGEFGAFSIEEIPGDGSYDVSLTLTDTLGKVRFEANRSSVYLPKGEEAKWDLSLLPSSAQAAVSLSLAPAKVTQLIPGFPTMRRKPNKIGEVVFSEFYAAPSVKDSSTQGEWFELFNRTSDTLDLFGCRISRDRNVSVTQSLDFDSLTFLPPGKAIVFGRSATLADFHYQNFTLVNTSSSLLLFGANDKIVLDSIRYSASVDTSISPFNQPIPIKEGWVNSLSADSVEFGKHATSWCQTQNGNTGFGYSSPGQISSCTH